MSERRPTITDVAARAGVSKSLVSFVFNDRPGVAADTRERILRVAEELGWRPQPTARSLSTRRSFALGLVLRRDPHVIAADAFFPGFISGVETVLSDEGQVLVLSMVPDAEAETRAYTSLAEDRRVDGVFLCDLRRNDPRLPLLETLGLPAVTLGRPDTASSFPVIDLDDQPGVTDTVRHLRDLGHLNIAYVAGDVDMLHGLRRRVSFLAAMQGLPSPSRWVKDTDFSPAAAARATAELLDADSRPTAIVYASDSMAMAGLGVIQARGMSAPEEVSVAGFDGAELTRFVFPSLTTVASDPRAWGRVAATSLLQLVAEGNADDVLLPAARLRIAHSTAPPPGLSHPAPFDPASATPAHPIQPIPSSPSPPSNRR